MDDFLVFRDFLLIDFGGLAASYLAGMEWGLRGFGSVWILGALYWGLSCMYC